MYKVTNTTTCGSDIGATPQKDATYLLVLTPSSEVPVLPPTRYPATCAFFPVPSATTLSIMLSIAFAFSSEIILSPVLTGTSVTSPVSLLIIFLTTLGVILVPPLAILLTAVAN